MASICDDVRNQVWGLIDGALGETERALFEAHLATCEACRREVDVCRRTWALLDLDAVPGAPDVTQRILNRVAADRRHRTRRRRLTWAGAAAAACLAAAVTLAVALRTGPAPDAPPLHDEPYIETQLVGIDQITDIELLYFAEFLETLDGSQASEAAILIDDVYAPVSPGGAGADESILWDG